mmetsp:Transcript_50966/g.114484  ORF Transcript_50966/g.114484 Transcript_50966/m.114484 type:complete len:605 (-) Transcript_50966:40-1854(-)
MKPMAGAESQSESSLDVETGGPAVSKIPFKGVRPNAPLSLCHCQVIHPETSVFLEVWDCLFLVILAVIGVATPLEAAFSSMDSEFWPPAWRVGMDTVLFADMLVQSLVAYQEKGQLRYVKDQRKIALHYLKGWFIVDLLSSFPWHAIENGNIPGLRLLRMLRLHAIGPIIARRQVRIGVSYAFLSLLKFLFGLSFTCHWMACCWAGVAYEVDDKHTWLLAVKESKGGLESTYRTPSGVYCLAVYWAIMTLTSIGYGDITPQTETEYWVASFCMIAMATVWAFVIGQMCAVVSTLLPHDVEFKRTMDDLNWLLSDSQIPQQLRQKLRRYFHESRSLCRLHEQKAIIAQMSPMLQGEVSKKLVDEWKYKVPYINGMSQDSLARMAPKLQPMLFAPMEAIHSERTLYIIRKGVCMMGGRVLVTGDVWGIDMILGNELLRNNNQARCLSYLEVLSLHHADLRDSLSSPEAKANLRWWQRRMATSRGFYLLATEIRKWERHGQNLFRNLPQSARCAMVSSILRGTFTGSTPMPQPVATRKTSNMSLASLSTQHSHNHAHHDAVHGEDVDAKEDTGLAAALDLEDMKRAIDNLTQSVEGLRLMMNHHARS